MKSQSPRSLPPPTLPRDLVARARIAGESEELGGVEDARTQAVLHFELSALHEFGLADPRRAEAHLRRALQQRPRFWPALLALARLYADQDQPAPLAAIWEALGRSSRVPASGALALSYAARLLHDRLNQKERAVALWNDAIALDPSCLEAVLLLEQHHRAAGDERLIQRTLELRAAAVSDAALEAALLTELAAAEERAGQIDAALERLAQASELDPRARGASYACERIARKHARHAALVAALDALAAREQGSKTRIAARLCEAGRVLALRLSTPAGARLRYDRALALHPGDPLALWERALLARELAGAEPGTPGALAAAIADLRALIQGAERDGDALAAAARVRLAELLAAEGAAAEARQELARAVGQAPDSAAACAAFEDALLRAGEFAALRDHLLARGGRAAGAARAEHTLRAGRIALLELGATGAALDLIRRASVVGEQPEPRLRALYAAALFAGDDGAAIEAGERLCAGELDPLERSLLRFDQYHRLRAADEAAGRRLLAAVLAEPALASWVGDAARLAAAGARDYGLLAAAQRLLAERAQDDRRAAAHLCGAARALLRGGKAREAVETAREALRRAPDDAYALALIEECLLLSGAEREAARVLREAARAHEDGKQRELALLAAGAAAEAAGELQTAARSYEDAADADPSSLAPRWALRRLAERTGERARFVRALERLAEQEAGGGDSGLSSLELGELRAGQGAHAAATRALSVALQRADTRAAAALELCLLPVAEVAPELREAALSTLVELCQPPDRVPFLRDGIAILRAREASGAKALLEAALSEHGEDAGLSVAALFSAEGPRERAACLERLARALDPVSGAGLALHALRVAQLAQGDTAAEDALLRALALAESAPRALAAQVALDEALGAGDDPESRASALAGRLAHADTTLAAVAPLQAAHARALFNAGRARVADAQLPALLTRDSGDLSLWELQWVCALALGEHARAAHSGEQLAQSAQGPWRARLLERTALLWLDELAEEAPAERCLRAAFAVDAGAELAFAWLHDRLAARRELGALLGLIERRMGAEREPARWIELGYERALVLRAAGQKADAIAALAQVLALDPQHAAALGLLTEVCSASERWPEAVDALRGLASAPVPEAQQRLARLGAAEILELKLRDLRGAAAELETQRVHTPGDADVLARLGGVYERAGRYREAVLAYREAAGLRFGTAAAELERRAGAVLRLHLGAMSEAIEAFERALHEDPLDTQACAELLALVDDEAQRKRWLQRLEHSLEQALARAPARPELLRALRRFGALAERPDVEFVALAALSALVPLNDDERAALEEASALAAGQPPLPEAALAELGGELSSALVSIARQISRALEAEAGEAGAGAQSDPSRGAAETPEQRFEAGMRALARALGLGALLARPREEQREALLAAFALGGASPGSAAIDATAKRLGRHIPRAERKELARLVTLLPAGASPVDAFLDALAVCCARAGMLEADDPRPALARALHLREAARDPVAAAPQALELLRFWLSRSARELRLRRPAARMPSGPARATPRPASGRPASAAPRPLLDAELDAALDALRPSLVPESQPPANGAAPSARSQRPPSVRPAPLEADSTPPGAGDALLLALDSETDSGAETAYRGIPQRLTPELRARYAPTRVPSGRERAELLEHLAGQSEGRVRAQLLAAAAESFQRAGESRHARALFEQAFAEDPGDVLVLRELRKHCIAEIDAARAADLLAREAALPLPARERAFALLLLAELEWLRRDDPAAAERAAAQALALHESAEAGLLLFALHVRPGARRDREAAEALRRAAAALPAGPVKAALLLEAGRLLLARGEAIAAEVLCAHALEADPLALDAAMCGTRAARAAGDPRAALAALERLEQSLATPALRDHALRARARLHEAAGDGALALRLLGHARSLPASRVRARLSEQLRQPAEQRAALEHWAEVAGGPQRALALLGLCELQLALGDGRAAASALERAAHADAGSALVRTWQAQLARATGETAALSERPGLAGGGERLQAAARLAAAPDQTATELGLLEKARGQSHSIHVLAVDAAAELGEPQPLARALALSAEQLTGPARAALELLRAELLARSAQSRAGRAPSEPPPSAIADGDAHTAALGCLVRIHYTRDRAALGPLWLELAGHARGELAAWAATLAGDYLRQSGRAREAYERALAAQPGHPPACWALEALLTDPSLRAPLARVHGALARVTQDPIERAARLLRAALLHEAEGQDKDGLARVAHELAAVSPVDALLCDRRLAAEDERVRLLLSEALEAGGHGGAGALTDLCALRAAAHYEDAGEHARAAVLYRAVQDRRGGESAHAEVGLERALALAGLHALLLERLEHVAARAETPPARREALERLAAFEAAVGDERRATRSLRALLELAPTDVAALLAVQREAMRDGDARELCRSAAGLARATSDPREREAQRCLLERAEAQLGTVTPDAGVRERSGEPDLREALDQERAARKRGEPAAIAEAVLGLCGHLRDDSERASYAMRAAEALEALSPRRAAFTLAPYAQAAPRHVLVHEALARLQHAAGDAREAAESFERAAEASPVRARTARLWHRAATLWQDALGEMGRARRALEAVLALDPRYRDGFERLRDLLSGEGDQNALCALYAARIAAGGDSGLLADLHTERARVLLRLEREDEARAALSAALALEPQRASVLRELSELQLSAGQYPKAAETLIRLARVAKDRAVLRKAFFELGAIYTEHLPDLRRAEIAYARAVELDPEDRVAIERLLAVYRRAGDHAKALRACERLIELAIGDPEIDRFTIELAAILEEMNDPRRAERALNARRERSPASPTILAALADLYARQNDAIALAVHLDRSLHALRLALEQAPGDAARFSIACELLLRRGRPGAAACVAAIAQDLGVADARGEQLAARHVSLGNAAFEPGLRERLLPEALGDAARALARWLEARAAELFAPLALENLASPQGALRSAVDYVREALGLRELAVLAIPGRSCIPLRSEPLALGVGRELIAECDADQLAFALLRAAVVARTGLLGLARGEPAELDALLRAARALARAPANAPAPAEADLVRERILALGPKRMAELTALVQRVRADGPTLRAQALLLGTRVGLAYGAAYGPAFSALAACETALAPEELANPLAALARSEDARAALRFALSDSYLDLYQPPASQSQPDHG